MKIALVAKPVHALPSQSRNYHTWAPGVVIATEAQALVDAGHDLRVYAASGSQVAGELVDLDFPPLIEANNLTDATQAGIRSVFDQNLYISRVIEHLKKNPVDVIHIHDYRDYPIFAAAGLADNLICTIHGDYAHNFSNRIAPTEEFMKSMNIIALTKPKPATPLPGSLAIIPNTFDAKRFSFVAKPKPRAVFVGRFSSGKGADLLPEIASKLDMQLDVYGGSPSERYDQELIDKLKSTPNVNFLGRLPHSKVHEAFDAQVLLFPSVQPEGFPLVLLEAASRGTPAVVFDLPGIDQIVKPSVTGEIVPLGKLDKFAEAANAATKVDRKVCRDHVQKSFGPKTFVAKLEQAFRAV